MLGRGIHEYGARKMSDKTQPASNVTENSLSVCLYPVACTQKVREGVTLADGVMPPPLAAFAALDEQADENKPPMTTTANGKAACAARRGPSKLARANRGARRGGRVGRG